MFSKELEHSLNQAFYFARENNHEFITIEHLLLSVLDRGEIVDLLNRCGANVERLRAGLSIFIEETTPRFQGAASHEVQPTLSFQRVLQRAIYQVQMSGGKQVGNVNIILALFGEPDSQSVYFLNQENITTQSLILQLDGVGPNNTESQNDINDNAGLSGQHDQLFFDQNFDSSNDMQNDAGFQDADTSTTVDESVVEQYTTNLNQQALLGKIDPLFCRDCELERIMQILCRRSKNNPLLIGDAGVGKTALAGGLAQAIVNGQAPKLLQGHSVYSLDLGVLVAGTKYRGDFEKRFKSVLSALGKKNNAIIFIDEIHNLVGAGSATGGTMDAANLIKPLLSSGEIRCMGATTYEEFRTYFSKDAALLRRFQKVDIAETTTKQTMKILHGIKSKYEEHHNVDYEDSALESAIKLSTRYMADKKLPDKAIDVLDEAGSMAQIANNMAGQKISIGPREIESVVASIARVPIKSINRSEKRGLITLARRLKKVVFGQDGAIEKLVDAIKLSRSGLRARTKPIGSFLMAGPTGVGKTELSQQLARNMGLELLRFDMSEYMEKHSVSRLIGAPPGYVGFDQGGLLTEKIVKHPHSVLLFDEIEKAHPDMFNLLLQVMDYGHLTDNNGRKIDFRHVVIMMTTNVGANFIERNTIGFKSVDTATADREIAVNKVFSPEFRNRLDGVLPFNPLSEKIILQVVDKCMSELSQLLDEHNVKVNISSSAKIWLASKGFDKSMGARPMERIIQEHCKKPLAEKLISDSSINGKTVQIGIKDDEICLEYS